MAAILLERANNSMRDITSPDTLEAGQVDMAESSVTAMAALSALASGAAVNESVLNAALTYVEEIDIRMDRLTAVAEVEKSWLASLRPVQALGPAELPLPQLQRPRCAALYFLRIVMSH